MVALGGNSIAHFATDKASTQNKFLLSSKINANLTTTQKRIKISNLKEGQNTAKNTVDNF